MASNVDLVALRAELDATPALAGFAQLEKGAIQADRTIGRVDESLESVGKTPIFPAGQDPFTQIVPGVTRASQSIGQFQGSNRAAQQAVLSLSQGLSDVAVTADGTFTTAMRAGSNNLEQFLSLMGSVAVQSKATGTTVASSLVGAISGPVGLIAALAAVQLIAPAVQGALSDLFESAEDKAEAAAERVAELYDRVVDLSGADFDVGVTFDTVQEAEYAVSLLGNELQRVEEERNRYLVQSARVVDLQTRQAFNRADAEGQALLRLVEELETRAADIEAFTSSILDDFDRRQRDREFSDIVGPAGTTARDREAERAAERAARDAERAATRSAREQERIAKSSQREQERLAKEAQRERERIAKEGARLLAKLRLEAIADERERELEVVRRTLDERVELAREAYGEQSEAEQLAVQLAAEQRAEIEAQFAREAFEEARQLEERRAQLFERLAALQGQTEEQALRDRIARLQQGVVAAREVYGEEEEAYREMVDAQIEAELELRELRARERERLVQAEQDAAERIARVQERRRQREGANETEIIAERIAALQAEQQAAETTVERQIELRADLAEAEEDLADAAQRAFERRKEAIESYLLDAFDAIEAALTAERSLTEQEADLRRERLQQETRELEDQYRRRELTIEDYELRRRELAEESAELEAEAAEASASRVKLALFGVLDVAREIALEVIKQEIAKAVASQIAQVIKTIPFPANIFVAAGAAAATVALGALVPKFAQGGAVTGPGGPTEDRVPALLSAGEHVLTAREVEALGGHAEVERFRQLALRGALPRFAAGGAVRVPGRLAPVSPAADRTSAASPEIVAMQRQLDAQGRQLERAVDELVRLKQQPAPVLFPDSASRKVVDRAAREVKIRGGA